MSFIHLKGLQGQVSIIIRTENPLLPQDQQMPQLQEDNLHYFKHTPIFFFLELMVSLSMY
jgi:hypothetical protein